MATKGLGRGLGALIGGSPLMAPQPIEEKGERIQALPLSRVVPSPYQPRKTFRPEQLTELVASIRERGIIQPLIVRQVGDKYELIAGERRWRAAQEVGLKEVPSIVRSASDREVLELALVENLQRADLSPIEEAEAYALLINQFKLTQEQVAKRVGKGRVTVANSVRLLSLAPEIQVWVGSGQLSVGHAKVILGIASHNDQKRVAGRVLKDNLTVRQTEKLVESLRPQHSIKPRKASSVSVTEAAWLDLEKRLQRAVGTKVHLHGSSEVGKIEIEFFSSGELDRLLRLLGVQDS